MRYFIFLQYDGTAYHGWQTQPDCVSVQETIEQKLSLLLRRELFIVGAGRTDAGVHSRHMAAHFEYDGFDEIANVTYSYEENRDAEGKRVSDYTIGNPEALKEKLSTLTFKLNGLLPPDISIDKIVPVKADAHARFSAISRTYKYYITTKKCPFDRYFSNRIYFDLDVEKMNQACEKLFLYRDFTSFAKLHTDVKTHICKIMEAHWEKEGSQYVFTIKADRFLRNMVRAIVGTMMQVGKGKITIDEFCKIIELQNRCQAGDSVPAQALFLEDVGYPDDIFM